MNEWATIVLLRVEGGGGRTEERGPRGNKRRRMRGRGGNRMGRSLTAGAG